MLEFGSDYHLCTYPLGKSLTHLISDANYYVDGRQALIALLKQNRWKRLWVPSYFCYEFIDLINDYIIVIFYDCNPESNPNEVIDKIPFKEGDVLLRINYFGLYKFYSSSNIPVEVIEDHSHDLIGEWSLTSDANWCIASLRKSLPIADGGILWSPKHHQLPQKPFHTNESMIFAQLRYNAMELKREYLLGFSSDKQVFRNIYKQTEGEFNFLPMSSISLKSYDIVSSLDIENWYKQKLNNWQLIVDEIDDSQYFRILKPEKNGCFPFSVIIVCISKDVCDKIKNKLISEQIYPAILWSIPNNNFPESQKIGDRILSLHCDSRYSTNNILVLISKLKSIFR